MKAWQPTRVRCVQCSCRLARIMVVFLGDKTPGQQVPKWSQRSPLKAESCSPPTPPREPWSHLKISYLLALQTCSSTSPRALSDPRGIKVLGSCLCPVSNQGRHVTGMVGEVSYPCTNRLKGFLPGNLDPLNSGESREPRE